MPKSDLEFPNFYFKINFESEDVSLKKVAPFYKSFTTIFYLKFLKLGKLLFGKNQV
jgi:hypothetical protein